MARNLYVWVGCAVMVLGGGYWLWANGYQNILGYAILLLCPLMHLFMHRGHGHQEHRHSPADGNTAGAQNADERKRPACH